MPHSAPIHRRSALQIGGLGMLGLTMPKLLRAAEQTGQLKIRAKSVIFLYQFGGPQPPGYLRSKAQRGPTASVRRWGRSPARCRGCACVKLLPETAR